ncbi:MAG: hypothetical protein EOO65_04865, partial [Methanosarcinales archaeon]
MPCSLCYNASTFNRLQFSLSFNYLNVLLHSNDRSEYPNTTFMVSVGKRMKLSVIDWYLPMIMPIVYILCRVNVFERIMRLMGIDEKSSPQRGNPVHDDIIKEGASLIAKTRSQLGIQLPDERSGGGSRTVTALPPPEFPTLSDSSPAASSKSNFMARMGRSGAAGARDAGAGAGGMQGIELSSTAVNSTTSGAFATSNTAAGVNSALPVASSGRFTSLATFAAAPAPAGGSLMRMSDTASDSFFGSYHAQPAAAAT